MRLAKLGIGDDPSDRCSEAGGVALSDNEAGISVDHDLGQAAAVERNDRSRGGAGFDRDERKPLVARRRYRHDVDRRENIGDVVTVTAETNRVA